MESNGSRSLEYNFPKLQKGKYKITSPKDENYNCIAWATGDNSIWCWPDPWGICYWPNNIPRQNDLQTFIQFFISLSYKLCTNDKLEPNYEKVAIFANNNEPTHAARQLKNGVWTSKLGKSEDIEHTLKQLTDSEYGQVAAIMKRASKKT